MAGIDFTTLALSKSYTDTEVIGAGAIKGKNCQIQSITDITGGHRVTFAWYNGEDVLQTSTLDVMDGANGQNGADGQDGQDGAAGADGVGISSIDFKEVDQYGNNVYTITLTDTNTYDFTSPKGATGATGADGQDGAAGADGDDGFSPTVIVKTQTQDSYVLTVTDANGSYDTPNLKGQNVSHAGFTPVGTVISVMGNAAPTNYLACNGQVVNIADYPELAAYFAEQFESANYFGGDGVTTFGIPDLRGEFLRGTGTNSHTDQGNGANVGVHQDATEIPRISVGTTIGAFGTPAASQEDSLLGSNVPNKTVSTTGTGSLSNSPKYTARPTNTSVLYCIATKNIFMDASSNYSTSEQVVGTWIDGKPIYQKTIDCGALPNATTKQVEHGIANIDLIIKVYATAYDSSKSNVLFIPYLQPKNLTNSVGISATKTVIGLASGSDRSSFTTTMTTLQYTKTTDA